MEQKRKDDQLRADIEKRQTDAERRQLEEKLRNENGALARSLQEKVTEEVREFAGKSESGDKTFVRRRWPALATWYREKIRGEWELENVGSELRDYGIVEWKNRVLEAGIVAITFKMKNRGLGEHRDKCFVVGFEIVRDPISVPCEDKDSIGGYKIAHKFSSKWFAK
jgi:hypothetical protein